MLQSLLIRNFRGFSNHIIDFRNLSVLVGRNNAGKSTIVEALRLVSIVTTRYRGFNYHHAPDWLPLPSHIYGSAPDIKGLDLDASSIFYEYRDPPAEIEARFSAGESVRIYLGLEGRIHAVIFDRDQSPVSSRHEAAILQLPKVAILPQPGPVARDERILKKNYVLNSLDSHLAPIHFRNQMHYLSQHYEHFCKVAEESWPGFRVQDLFTDGAHGSPIHLNVRNDEFVGEIARMGHGLQMWLQTIWFIARSKGASTLILDEPDIYMHPDLQRRLLRFIRTQAPQVIITTHSVEVLSEVEAENIVVVERRRSKSNFADSLPAVQSILTGVGSAHNIQLTRLWSARRFLVVEGDDLKLLRHLSDTIFPDSAISLESIPNIQIGGWGGWAWAVGSSLALKNAAGDDLMVYCLLDRDYYSDEIIRSRYHEAAEKGIHLHVWSHKELENYLVSPAAIARLLASRTKLDVGLTEVAEAVEVLSLELLEEVEDNIATQIQQEQRKLTYKSAKSVAQGVIADRLQRAKPTALVSGKELIRRLSCWSQDRFETSISASALARELKMSEMNPELKEVLRAIAEGRKFVGLAPSS